MAETTLGRHAIPWQNLPYAKGHVSYENISANPDSIETKKNKLLFIIWKNKKQ